MKKSEAIEVKDNLSNTFWKAPKEWQDFYVALRKIRSDVLKKIQSLDICERKKYNEKIDQKMQKSCSSVAEPSEYLCFHISHGSWTGPINSPKLDFEGEHSHLKFYQELLKELEENN